MSSISVTFETKCYEKDWEILVKQGRLKNMIEYNCYPFKEKILYINNVLDPEEVSHHADKLVKEGTLTSYAVVDEYAKEAMDFFDVTKESFKGGYYYSIEEMVSIYLCRTDYLVHFSSDSILVSPYDWVTEAIELMEADRRFKAANPTWNRDIIGVRNESFAESKNFYIGFGFSDQCYMIRTEDFRAKIYNEHNPASDRYPKYGGELFEKRVDSWMRNHQYYRITNKHISYIHKNY